MKNEAISFKENKEAYMGLSGWRKGKREMIHLYFNFKSKRKNGKITARCCYISVTEIKTQEHAKY